MILHANCWITLTASVKYKYLIQQNVNAAGIDPETIGVEGERLKLLSNRDSWTIN